MLFGFGLLPCVTFAENTGLQGVNLYRYRPALDPAGFLDMNSAQLMECGRWHFKLTEEFAFNHLLNLTVNGVTEDVVDRVLTTNILVSRSLTDFLTVAIDLPLHFLIKEIDVTTQTSATTESAGDIRVAAKLRLLEEAKWYPSLALLISSTIPTGSEIKFFGDDSLTPALQLLVSKDFRYLHVLANAGASFPKAVTVAGINFDDHISYALGFAIPLFFIDDDLAIVSSLHGSFQSKNIQEVTAPLAVTGGLRQVFSHGLQLELYGGGSLNNAVANPRLTAGISLSYAPSP